MFLEGAVAMRTLIILTALLAATACNRSNDTETAANVTGAPASNAIAEVDALPPASRDAVFLRAILDAGQPCQHVVTSQQLPDGNAPGSKWQAQCEDQRYHVIEVRPDGTAVVVSATGT